VKNTGLSFTVVEDSRLLGDDSFMDKCLASCGDTPLRLSTQEIIDKVCHAYNIDEATLKLQSQQRAASEARAVVDWWPES
jgi:chromosomal replication initiation ATPase DnaA